MPMPPGAYLLSKMAMAMLFAAIIYIVLALMARFLAGVHLDIGQWFTLGAIAVLGAIPFCALGLGIGYLAGPNSAQPIVNLLYLPMAFASGLWMPLEILPKFIQHLAPFLPPYHLAQLALSVTGFRPAADVATHVIALTGFTAVFLLLAAIGYQRDEGKTYG